MSKRYWKVRSTIDRGEGAVPRFICGYCHWDGQPRKRAEEIAREERLKGHIKVEIVECTRFGDLVNKS